MVEYPIPTIRDAYLKTLDAGIGSFPASRIQKGLVLGLGNRDLSEEGVGFGLPVIKVGLQTVFPGSWEISTKEDNGHYLIEAVFEMNLQARMARKGKIIENGLFGLAWGTFSKIHREYPQLRRWISVISRSLKKKLEMREVFSEMHNLGFVRASYLICNSSIVVELKFPEIDGCTELIVLNEQGANWFDTYRDSDGLVLKGDGIGSWDHVEAKDASFLDLSDGLLFTLKKVNRARMFRGRELVTGCLAWSGLAYVIPPEIEKFTYTIELDKI
jgi:hypothetical protein